MRVRGVSITLAACLLASSLALAPVRAEEACRPDPVGLSLESTGVAPFTEDPDAGWWRTWAVAVTTVPVPVPPASTSTYTAGELVELQANVAMTTPDKLAAIKRWDAGGAAYPWIDVLLGVIKTNSTRPDKNPPRISRDVALVTTAIFDALTVTWKAKHCYRRPAPWALNPALNVLAARRAAPSYPSEHATVAGVMKVMVPALYGQGVDLLVAEAVNSRLWAGANYRTDLHAGLAIGESVARKVLASRDADGSTATWGGGGRVTGGCNWEPTPPAFVYPPLEPVWGSVRPWVMTTASQVRPPPPPACDSPEYVAAARDVYEASLRLSDRQKEVAKYWAGGPGTETPPGMNLRTAMEQTYRRALTTMGSSRALALVGVGLADAAIAAWDAKFAYWADRPANTIRRLWDPAWTSFIGTPPFPGYVSGHSTFSATTMRILAGLFPDDAIAFQSMATEAAVSRFYGGIHVRYDNEVGLDMGRKIGDLTLARAASDGA